jgi:hypothetical protein
MENKTVEVTTALIRISKSELSARVIEKPFCIEWDMPAEFGGHIGVFKENGSLNYEGLNEHEKLILYVYAWNLSDICPFRRTVMKEFSWSAYKVSKMCKALMPYGLKCIPVVSERTGLLAGRGYEYHPSNQV